MVRRKKKGQFLKRAQMPAFAWIFSLIIGAFILFFAFFFIAKVGQTSEKYGQAVYATSLDVLLEPFTSSIASGQSDIIDLQRGTFIKTECSYTSETSFGKSILKARAPGLAKSEGYSFDKAVYDKYIFSKEINLKSGKLFVISVPFEMPFRVSDLMMLIGDNYCFAGLPHKYNKTIADLSENVSNAGLTFKFVPASKIGECDDDSIKVCWNPHNDEKNRCDVRIYSGNGNYGNVSYRGNAHQYPWIGNLVIAAMFSDHHVYECNFKRLMLKAKTLADLYEKQDNALGRKGCSTGIGNSLVDLKGKLDSLNLDYISSISSTDMGAIWSTSQSIDSGNSNANCKLY